MKIADLEKVESLCAERDYVLCLIVSANAIAFTMRIGKYDVRPDLKDRATPALVEVFRAEAARIEADLAALGVTVDGGGEA